MTSDEIRKMYLDFFVGKEHLLMPSSSLIPEGDPTLLLTTAGMVQFKPYFMGEAEPPAKRLTSCQKCFRTTDIESVGDVNHLTFFEMLGNFSVGDYFKKEAIAWAWQFVTEKLKLPSEKLWITIYLDDDESFEIWQKTGVPAERIIRFGEEDNFWGPPGASGPCGPCTEIHYDFGEEYGCGREDCTVGCSCGRFSEIWNLVFTQYYQDTEGNRSPLKAPNIDTGMGLERIAAVMQNVHSVYQTDVFQALIQKISGICGLEYGADAKMDNAMRIVAEHGRSITFLIADGVMPSNEGRGYVLRRLLRRATLFSRRLKSESSLLDAISEITIKKMSHVYPEIRKRDKFIRQVIADEESRFQHTLDTGLELLDGIMEMMRTKKEKMISGANLFKLYDTYGFPVEITREIAAENSFEIDLAGYENEMTKQRERARNSSKFDTSSSTKEQIELSDLQVAFCGYDKYDAIAKIEKIFLGDESVKKINDGQNASIILDVTPFYGEMGGQVGDKGEILTAGGLFQVNNTIHLSDEVILHQGKVLTGIISVGDEVNAQIDCENRLDIARNHTATHLLHQALRETLGEHAQQKGSLVAPDKLRFDFSHLKALKTTELQDIEKRVNELIRLDISVTTRELPYRQALDEGAIALFGEKYGNKVRVLKIGRPAVSTELCGGTHVSATGEIGFFKILSEGSVGAGLRRIEAVTGRGAEAYVTEQNRTLSEIAVLTGSAITDSLDKKIASLINELEEAKHRCRQMENKLAVKTASELLNKVTTVNGIKVLSTRVPDTSIDVLRTMSDWLREKLDSAVTVLGTVYNDKPLFLAVVSDDLVKRGYHAGNIIREVARVTGGGGGGKPNMAQAGGKNKSKMKEALELVAAILSREAKNENPSA